MTTRRRVRAWLPPWVVAPGEILLKGLEEYLAARRMARPAKTINEIIKGKAAITPETAIQLERALGIRAHFWMGVEGDYRLAVARLKVAEQELKATQREARGGRAGASRRLGRGTGGHVVIPELCGLATLAVVAVLAVRSIREALAADRRGQAVIAEAESILRRARENL